MYNNKLLAFCTVSFGVWAIRFNVAVLFWFFINCLFSSLCNLLDFHFTIVMYAVVERLFFFRLLLHTEDEAKTFRHPFGNLLKIRWARITYQNERNWLLKSNWQEIFRQFVRKRNKIAYSHCRKINHPHTDVCVVRSSWNVLFHFVVFFPNLAESFNSDLFCSILCTFFFFIISLCLPFQCASRALRSF